MTAARLPSVRTTEDATRPLTTLATADAALVVFLGTWKAIVIVGDYPPFILPAPDQVLSRFLTAWADGTMSRHAGQTLIEVGLGFGVGASLAIVAGYALARSALVERV